MQNAENLVLTINRKKVVISISTILYILMTGNNAKIHVCGGTVYEIRITMQVYWMRNPTTYRLSVGGTFFPVKT